MTPTSIEEARITMMRAGYYCIPREKVLRVQASVDIAQRLLLVPGRDTEHYVMKDLSRALAHELVGVMTVDQAAGSAPDCVRFQASLSLLPQKYAVDPIIELIRERQK